ncbi:hypothetical protein HPT27_04110 [Permianibacter sp. IMCC34836]|uniref:SEL1-like repeat protein n=1 Tax=Permianibacter fluminis TaxID=2738515 RepID=UPI00155427B2|nr:SEL1-like repeat protein [Permianibacter fluminis]NQD36197.1 hypothetical protein [Permianibacter fluminis]
MRLRHPVFFFGLVLGCATPALADFSSAMTAYEQKQFDVAYAEFRRLAELGDAPSQRNLAVMYARGEHVDKSPVDAWAWADLAAEQDTEHAPKLRDVFATKLDEASMKRARELANELQSKFGQQAITAHLLPVVADRQADCTVSGDSPAQPVRTKAPRYPMAAAQAGVTGYACLNFYIDVKGRPQRARVYESGIRELTKRDSDSRLFRSLFEKSSLAAVKDWEFLLPANEQLREMQARYCLDYRLDEGNSGAIAAIDPKKTKAKLTELTPLAEAGDGKAQYELANVIKTELITGQKRQKELDQYSEKLFLQSAINGDSRGQYKLASKLLTGDRCEKDTSKGIFWLTVSAQQGNADSAWLLAQKLDIGGDVAQQKEKSLKWLKVAADGGHKRAQLQYALALLEQGSENAAEARSYLPPFTDTDDIALLEAYARLSALSGGFDSAVKYQEQVVSIATELEFALPAREQALAAYRKKALPSTAGL